MPLPLSPFPKDNSIVANGRLTVTWGEWFLNLWTVLRQLVVTAAEVTFDAARFTASGAMTWTVPAATVGFMADGTRMHLTAYVPTSTIGGTPGTELRIALPDGYTAHGVGGFGTSLYSQDGVTWNVGTVWSQGSYIAIYKQDFDAWALGAVAVYCSVSFPVVRS